MPSSFIKLLFLSSKRTRILLYLMDGPKKIFEINKALNSSSVEVLPQLKKLRKSSLIKKTRTDYRLTPLGIAITVKMKPLINLIKLFGTRYDYWSSHKFECIPGPLFERIEELSNCTFTKPTDRSFLFEPHEEWLINLSNSNEVRGICSFFSPSFISSFQPLLINKVNISLIVTPLIYERIKSDFVDNLKEFLKYEYGSFYVCNENIEFSLVITDKFFNLSLPFSDGNFDIREDVVSFDPLALQWGEELFTYYRNLSVKIIE